jgi:predicted RNA binding protein YcfA (HicA-like mRNA interferase family)
LSNFAKLTNLFFYNCPPAQFPQELYSNPVESFYHYFSIQTDWDQLYQTTLNTREELLIISRGCVVMIPIIDYSLFSLKEFQRSQLSKSGKTSSLLLFQSDHYCWGSLFREKPGLWTYIHEQFEGYHAGYISFIPSEEYLNRYPAQLRMTLDSAKDQIKNKLIQIGIPVDTNQQYSDWISFLQSDVKQLDYGCQLVKQQLNYTNQSPLLIIWTDRHSKELIVIHLPDEHPHLEKMYKAIILALRDSTESLLKEHRKLNAEQLQSEYRKYLQRSKFFQKGTNSFPFINLIKLNNSIKDVLASVGHSYSIRFDDALANYNKYPDGKTFSVKYSSQLTYKVKRLMREEGFVLIRQGKHEVWKHPKLNKPTLITRHNQQSPSTFKSIMADILKVIASSENPPKSQDM